MTLLNNCPLCNAPWSPRGVMRRPLKNITCPVCLAERKKRIAYAEASKSQKLAESDQSKAKWDAMTPEERKAYNQVSLRIFYGCEEFDNRG